MLKYIILSSLAGLFFIHSAVAQALKKDTASVTETNHLPINALELDSIDIFSPEILYDYFVQGTLSSGYILSQFNIPANGQVISHYGPRSGRMHTGTDIRKEKGDTIYAAFYGQIAMAKYYHGYGNLVVIDHGNKLETYYGHLSKILVKPGVCVKIGEPIGLAGSTGRATCNHLHFEIREQDKPYDAEMVFDFEQGKTRVEVAKMENLAALHKEMKPKGYASNKPVSENYIVRAGDSLYKIAKRTKTSINALCKLNNLTEASVLQIGQRVKVF